MLKGKLAGRPPWIRFQGQAVGFVNEAPYLGVIIDKNLTFIPHVRTVNLKAKALFDKITRLIKLKYEVKFPQLNFLYKTVFLPIMGYGLRGWIHRLDHSHIAQKLRDAQRQVLISITGAFRTSPLSALSVITNNLPLHLKLKFDYDCWKIKRGQLEGSRRDVMERYVDE